MTKEPSTQESVRLDRIERALTALTTQVTALTALTTQVTALTAAHEALKARIEQFLGPAADFTDTLHQLGELTAKNLGTGTTQAETLASLLAAMRGLQRATESVLALSQGFDKDRVRDVVKV